MVREHHDPVWAGGQTRRGGDASELPVDPGQNRDGVASLGPRVVGNLVVTEKRRVHDGPPRQEVGNEDLDLDVALHCCRIRAHEGIRESTIHTRTNVIPPLLSRVPHLHQDIFHCEHQGASEVVRAGEESEVLAADRPMGCIAEHHAHRQQTARSVARQDVAAARAVEC